MWEEAGKGESRKQARPGDISNSLPCASGRLWEEAGKCERRKKDRPGDISKSLCSWPNVGTLWEEAGKFESRKRPSLATFIIRFAAGPMREDAGKCDRRKPGAVWEGSREG